MSIDLQVPRLGRSQGPTKATSHGAAPICRMRMHVVMPAAAAGRQVCNIEIILQLPLCGAAAVLVCSRFSGQETHKKTHDRKKTGPHAEKPGKSAYPLPREKKL